MWLGAVSITRLIVGPLQSEIAQGRVVVGAAAKRPVVLAFALLDRDIIDAGDAKPHQAVLIEFPVLVAVAAEPITAVVVPLIGKAHGDTVLTEGPHFLDQPVVQLAVPFARKKFLDGLAALQEFGTISPAAVGRVGERDAGGIAGIPYIFGLACLLRSSLGGERRKRRSTTWRRFIAAAAELKRLGHQHQVGQRRRTHFAHRRAAMNFDGDFA
jgi:hypothetical protein